MAKLSRVLGLLLILSPSSLVVGGAAQSGRPTTSEVVRDCDDTRGCVPDSTSLVVVYVCDAAGLAVADMTVALEEGPGASASAVSVRTDRDGMAAVSVRPGQSYSIRITGRPGWIPLTTETKLAVRGGTLLFRVVMRVPPIVDSIAAPPPSVLSR